MNKIEIVFALALIAFCCVNLGHSLKCFTCDGKKDCNSPKRYDCNRKLANETSNYLDLHYVNVPKNATSLNYECMRDRLKSKNGEFYHRGCIYNNIQSCNLVARPAHQQGKHERSCYQCSNKDGCNPADRAGANLLTVCAAIAAAMLGKFVWRN